MPAGRYDAARVRKWIIFIVRLAVGLAALALLFSRFSITEALTRLDTVSWPLVAVALGLGALGVVLSAYKWFALVNSDGGGVAYPLLLRLYFEGIFFNNFLPTSIGGDVHRAYQLGKHTDDKAASLATVVVERLTGLIALVGFAIGGTVLARDLLGSIPGLVPAVALISILTLAATVVMFNPKAAHWAALPFRGLRLIKIADKVEAAAGAVAAFKQRKKTLATALLTSALFNVILIAQLYVLVAATGGGSVPLSALAGSVPLVVLAANVPVSIGGLGIQEGGLVLVLSELGLISSQALSVALLSRLTLLLLALYGLGIWVLRDRSGKSTPVKAQ